MFYSQIKQDEILYNRYFKDLTNGVFVDIGAHDGITGSNTLFYEKHLNWTGICIEPLPSVYKQLIENRSCVCLNYAICNSDGEKDFLEVNGYSEMLSGLVEYYDARHLSRVNRELQQYGGSTNIIKVKTRRMKDVLTDTNIKEIHYLSIDAEGSELEILKSIDYDRVFIHVIDIENNYGDTFHIIRDFLVEKGFINKFSIEFDEIFVNKNSHLLKMEDSL